MSQVAARRRQARTEPETEYTDSEIRHAWSRLQGEVQTQMWKIEGLIRGRELGRQMSPDEVRYLLRRRGEFRRAMRLFSGH